MNRVDWKRWSSLFLLLILLAPNSCRKESPKDPVEESKIEDASGKTAEDDVALIGPEDIADQALEDTGLKQEMVEPVDIPPAPSLGANLKGWKPPKNETVMKNPAPSAQLPKDMWILADVLLVRSGPASKFGQVGSLRYGEKVTVVAVTDSFAKIGDQRFVAMRYLTDRKAKFIPAKK